MSAFTIFLILMVIVAFLLIVVIMVQNPKGGGLSSSFGGSGGTQQMGGVQKTGDFLDKSTWFLATALIVLILASNLTIGSGGTTESKALDTNEPTDMPITAPATTDSPATTEDTSGS